MGVYRETSRFTSIEDFRGLTVIVWLGFADKDLEFDYFPNQRPGRFVSSDQRKAHKRWWQPV